jgi:hypothetical protein
MCAGTNCTTVLPRQRSTDLLHLAALAQAAEVSDEEAGVLEQRDDLGLGLGVVAGQEDHPLAARLVWVGAEHGGHEGVGGPRHTRGGDEIGDDLAVTAIRRNGGHALRRSEPLELRDG